MKRKLTLRNTFNSYMPEIKVFLNGKLLGHASMSGVDTVGGSDKVWDNITPDEFILITTKLNKLLMRDYDLDDLDVDGQIRHWNAY